MIVLTRPSPEYVKSFTAAIREPREEAEMQAAAVTADRQISPFAHIMKTLLAMSREDRFAREEQANREGQVAVEPPSALTFWLVNGREYLGEALIRLQIPKANREIEDDISYYIRPSRRRRGYGKLILKLALERARELGLERVYLSCSIHNPASRKVIEANGGNLLEESFAIVNGVTERTRRYFIDL